VLDVDLEGAGADRGVEERVAVSSNRPLPAPSVRADMVPHGSGVGDLLARMSVRRADMENRESRATPVGGSNIRVLVENGEYWLNNKGDLGILNVTVRRIAERWPDAAIGVLTDRSSLLKAYEPNAEPIRYQRGGDWPRRRGWGGLAGRFGPEVAGPLLRGWEAAAAAPGSVVRRARRVVLRGGEGDGTNGESDARTTNSERLLLSRDGGRLPNAIDGASLVLAIGGGYLTDIDRFQTERTLDLLEYATNHRIPTAMVGQGIGPIHDPGVLEHAARVLPRVDFIALREGLRGPELLHSLGVPPERVVVTGDDAVELGYSTRRRDLGTDIGVCLRVAEYSPVGDEMQKVLGRVIRGVAAESGAGLVPLIVSEHDSEDRRSTMPLLAGFPDVVPPLGRFASARSLSRRIGRCRIIVTGAYHVAVFALSQGIPVVGLSTSRYYDDKFEGLAAMFDAGLELVRLDGEDFDDRLRGAMRSTWLRAPELRAGLLGRAVNQIDASRAAFDRAAQLVKGDITTRSNSNPGPTWPPTSST